MTINVRRRRLPRNWPPCSEWGRVAQASDVEYKSLVKPLEFRYTDHSSYFKDCLDQTTKQAQTPSISIHKTVFRCKLWHKIRIWLVALVRRVWSFVSVKANSASRQAELLTNLSNAIEKTLHQLDNFRAVGNDPHLVSLLQDVTFVPPHTQRRNLSPFQRHRSSLGYEGSYISSPAGIYQRDPMNKCVNCGSPDHSSTNCPHTKPADEGKLASSHVASQAGTNVRDPMNTCVNCGSPHHTSTNCPHTKPSNKVKEAGPHTSSNTCANTRDFSAFCAYCQETSHDILHCLSLGKGRKVEQAEILGAACYGSCRGMLEHTAGCYMIVC